MRVVDRMCISPPSPDIQFTCAAASSDHPVRLLRRGPTPRATHHHTTLYGEGLSYASTRAQRRSKKLLSPRVRIITFFPVRYHASAAVFWHNMDPISGSVEKGKAGKWKPSRLKFEYCIRALNPSYLCHLTLQAYCRM